MCSVITQTNVPLIISPDTFRGEGDQIQRTPPGQTLTKKWPVLHFGAAPHVDIATWELRVFGLCENPYTLNYQEFLQLPQIDVKCDIHCVTHWSRLDNIFRGVPTKVLIDLAKPTEDAKFVMQHAASEPNADFTVNVPLNEFTQDDCVLAYLHDGESLSKDHGYPVRGIVPQLYFWKGAKWITGIELRATNSPGFWELNGYHMHGNPWAEERYAW